MYVTRMPELRCSAYFASNFKVVILVLMLSSGPTAAPAIALSKNSSRTFDWVTSAASWSFELTLALSPRPKESAMLRTFAPHTWFAGGLQTSPLPLRQFSASYGVVLREYHAVACTASENVYAASTE